MATTFGQSPFQERRSGERRRVAYMPLLRGTEGMRVSWGGVWGGVVVALGVLLLSGALGFAVGISSLDPGVTTAAALGRGAAMWGGASLLVALFLGGLVSTRIGATFDRATGMVEGMLVWVVCVMLGAAAAGTGVVELSVYGDIDRLIAATTPTTAAWITFGVLLASLFASIVGAAAGRRVL